MLRSACSLVTQVLMVMAPPAMLTLMPRLAIIFSIIWRCSAGMLSMAF